VPVSEGGLGKLKEWEVPMYRLICFMFALVISVPVVGQTTDRYGNEPLSYTVGDSDTSPLADTHVESSELDLLVSNTIEFPCRVWLDVCMDDYRVNVGDMKGKYTDAGRTAWADNYFDGDGNDCGSGIAAGRGTVSHDLTVYVANAWLLDETSDDGGQVHFQLIAKEYSGFDCGGTLLRTFSTEDVYCSSTAIDVTAQQAWADTSAGCASYGDPISCRLPDVFVTAPTAGNYSYWTQVSTWVCDADGSPCTGPDTDTGCFDFVWAN